MERPKTRNPKLHHLVEELEHEHHGEISPSNRESEAHMSRDLSKGSFHRDAAAEVFWSASGDAIPTEQLARPITSNPRYARDTSTSTPLRAEDITRTPPAADQTSTSPTSETNSDQRTTGAPVLWAAEGAEVDPGLVARPITSNPWLARVIDTSLNSPRTPEEATPPVQKTNVSLQESHAHKQQQSEIIWASDEVTDWRLLARPHAANPVYEAAAAEVSTPCDAEEHVPGARRDSEVLWKRDDQGNVVEDHLPASTGLPPSRDQQEGNEGSKESFETFEYQRKRIEALEFEVTFLRQLLTQNNITLPTPTDVIMFMQEQQRQTEAAAAAAKELVGEGEAVANVSDEAVQTVDRDSPVDTSSPIHKDKDEKDRTLSPAPAKDEVIYDDDTAEIPPEQEALMLPTTTQQPPKAAVPFQQRPGGSRSTSSTATTSNKREQQRREEEEEEASTSSSRFVNRYRSGMRPGTALAGGRPKPHIHFDSGLNMGVALESPSVSVRGSAGKARKEEVVHHRVALRTMSPSRPQSAPIQRTQVGHQQQQRRVAGFGSTINTAHSSVSTETLTHQNADAVSMEYEKLRRANADYVEKADFAEAYRRRAAEYGVHVTDKAIERLLKPYKTAGPNYLTQSEFAILYLKLEQW